MEYTVELTVYAENPLTDEQLEAAAGLAGAAGGNAGEHRLTTTLTIDADSIGAAMVAASKQVLRLVPGHVVQASVALPEEFDRLEADQRRRAELVGIAEVAELLGLSKPRVTELARDRKDAPAPVARLRAGPVWRKADWSTFAEGWQRKGGRPRKVAQEEATA